MMHYGTIVGDEIHFCERHSMNSIRRIFFCWGADITAIGVVVYPLTFNECAEFMGSSKMI